MKRVLITGVSRGIGKATAQKFLDNGDFVIGTSTNGKVDSSHKNLKIIALDLALPASIKKAVSEIEKLKVKVDILINNAAVWSGNEDDPVIHSSDLRRTLEVNLIGTADFTEQVIHLLNPDAHILNLSSSAGSLEHTHHAFYPDYKISKAALNMFTRILAVRLEGKALVSSIHPGWVKTDMGGPDADIEPEEAAEDIFKLANSKVESGQFWFKEKKFPW